MGSVSYRVQGNMKVEGERWNVGYVDSWGGVI